MDLRDHKEFLEMIQQLKFWDSQLGYWKRASTQSKYKLFEVLKPENWNDNMMHSVVNFLADLIWVFPRKTFPRDHKHLVSIYVDFCKFSGNTKSSHHTLTKNENRIEMQL